MKITNKQNLAEKALEKALVAVARANDISLISPKTSKHLKMLSQAEKHANNMLKIAETLLADAEE